MPATSNLVVGRGRLFFNHFADGTMEGPGYDYLGNTPSLSVAKSQTALDHYDADTTFRAVNDSFDLSVSVTGQFACDNISDAVLSLLFGGGIGTGTQTASVTPVVESAAARPDSWLKLGVTTNLPMGVKSVNGVSVTASGGTPVFVAGVDYEVDEAAGMVHFLRSVLVADDVNGVAVAVTYSADAVVAAGRVIGAGRTAHGQLKFVSTNPKGSQRDYFWPYVKVTANGDFQLKGDTWQQASFSFEALTMAGMELQYITQRPSAVAA